MPFVNLTGQGLYHVFILNVIIYIYTHILLLLLFLRIIIIIIIIIIKCLNYLKMLHRKLHSASLEI